MVLSSAQSITERVGTPRSALVDLPLGHTSGPPNDPATQRQILLDGFAAAAATTSPGACTPLAWRWADEAWKSEPRSWSRAAQEAGNAGKPSGDTRGGRSDEPVWQEPSDADAAAAVAWDDQCEVCIGLARPEHS